MAKKESVEEKMARMRAVRSPQKPKEDHEHRKVTDEEFEDTHDQLVKAYLEYFKTYFRYLEQDSYRTYYAHQKSIRRLLDLTKLIQKDSQDHFYRKRERPGSKVRKRKNKK